jgi:hypothetical protein
MFGKYEYPSLAGCVNLSGICTLFLGMYNTFYVWQFYLEIDTTYQIFTLDECDLDLAEEPVLICHIKCR